MPTPNDLNAECGLRIADLKDPINPQSAIRNPQSDNLQSAICNPQSDIPHSAFRIPHFRLGSVAYLNMQPLVYGLDEAFGKDGLEICEGPPSRLARWLEEGRIDIGMVPVGSLLRHPEWRVVGRGIIGARGTVRSVLVAGGGPPESWRVLHPDSHSLTSNALAKVLLKGSFGIEPEPGEPLALDAVVPPAPAPGEAWVLIGSRALAWRRALLARPGCCVLDMGEAWMRWTGLPFIFAVWAARPGVPDQVLAQWAERLEQHQETNAMRLPRIAREWPDLAKDDLSVEGALEYFTQNIWYRRGEAERQGLERFYAAGRAMGLFHEDWAWREAGD